MDAGTIAEDYCAGRDCFAETCGGVDPVRTGVGEWQGGYGAGDESGCGKRQDCGRGTRGAVGEAEEGVSAAAQAGGGGEFTGGSGRKKDAAEFAAGISGESLSSGKSGVCGNGIGVFDECRGAGGADVESVGCAGADVSREDQGDADTERFGEVWARDWGEDADAAAAGREPGSCGELLV